jgi:signal peptidase
MVVTLGSMEPAFQRGDLIFLWSRGKTIHTGDIPVIWITGNPLPMVHWVITVSHEVETDGHLKYVLTSQKISRH